MRRRMLVPALIAGLVLYAAPVLAQQPVPARVPRVGILTPAESDQTPIFEAFRRGLKDLGYTEGRNIAVEFRSAQGNSALLPSPDISQVSRCGGVGEGRRLVSN